MANPEAFASARAKPHHLARELEPRERLPYARHLTDRIVRLDNGALMMSFRLDGASFETADVRDLNDWHTKLNGAWRNLASDRLAIWHHLVRRREDAYPEGEFRSAFARSWTPPTARGSAASRCTSTSCMSASSCIPGAR